MTNPADFLPPYRPQRTRKVKPKVDNLQYLKDRYYAAREVGFAREYAEANKDGHYFKSDFPDLTTTNGTEKYIKNAMNWLGCFGEKVITAGTFRNGQYHHASNTKGSSDIHCHIVLPGNEMATPWKIEVKKGSDSLRKAQEVYRSKMAATGALHTVVYVGQLTHFWECYDKIMQGRWREI